jgi:hypothetical protein
LSNPICHEYTDPQITFDFLQKSPLMYPQTNSYQIAEDGTGRIYQAVLLDCKRILSYRHKYHSIPIKDLKYLSLREDFSRYCILIALNIRY